MVRKNQSNDRDLSAQDTSGHVFSGSDTEGKDLGQSTESDETDSKKGSPLKLDEDVFGPKNSKKVLPQKIKKRKKLPNVLTDPLRVIPGIITILAIVGGSIMVLVSIMENYDYVEAWVGAGIAFIISGFIVRHELKVNKRDKEEIEAHMSEQTNLLKTYLGNMDAKIDARQESTLKLLVSIDNNMKTMGEKMETMDDTMKTMSETLKRIDENTRK